MSKSIPAPTPNLNRLRAAAALIPIIESGLSDGKLSIERAALMASFCEWAAQTVPENDTEQELAKAIVLALGRLKVQLAESSHS